MNEVRRPPGSRMRREAKTVSAMITIYCRANHGAAGGLCPDCQELNDYAMLRLSKCRFQEAKTTCGKCRVHCYNPDMRQEIRMVMRYAGPRMIYRHPIMAAFHVIDSRRKEPVK